MTLEIFTYGFMQRALVSGIAIALLCSVVGLFLVSDAEAETPILWPPDAKNGLIGKDPDAGRG